jgi:hypothetical protein
MKAKDNKPKAKAKAKPQKPQKPKRGPGQPTKYSDAKAAMILGYMSGGLSLTAAAALCDVSRDTVYSWENKVNGFSDILKMGRIKRQAFLEQRLLAAKDNPTVISTIFALKNAAPGEWRDRHDVEHSGQMDISVTIGGDAGNHE